MRKVLAGGAVVAAALIAVMAFSGVKSVSRNHATGAAFRDGVYTGKLAVERGEKPHLALGRWSTKADRDDFVAGYQVAYNNGPDAPNAAVSRQIGRVGQTADPNSKAAFRDGNYLGKLDADQGRASHLNAARWSRPEDRKLFAAGYDRGYQYEEEVSAANQANKGISEALLNR